jgi:hypothetical protein
LRRGGGQPVSNQSESGKMPDLHLKANGFPCAFFNVHQSFFNSFGNPKFAMIALHEPNHIRFQTNASQASWATAAVLRRALPVDLYWLRCLPTPAYLFPPALPTRAGRSISSISKA